MLGNEVRFVSFSKVARRLDVHPYSVFRWHKVGRGPGHIKLRAVKAGGRWRTRWKWVREFMAALEGAEPPNPEPRTAADRRRDAEDYRRVQACTKRFIQFNDEKILAAVGTKPLTAEELATRSGHECSDEFRRHLAFLKRRGELGRAEGGYVRPQSKVQS